MSDWNFTIKTGDGVTIDTGVALTFGHSATADSYTIEFDAAKSKMLGIPIEPHLEEPKWKEKQMETTTEYRSRCQVPIGHEIVRANGMKEKVVARQLQDDGIWKYTMTRVKEVEPPNGYRLLTVGEPTSDNTIWYFPGDRGWGRHLETVGPKVGHGWHPTAELESWASKEVDPPEGFEWATRDEVMGKDAMRYYPDADRPVWRRVTGAESTWRPNRLPIGVLYAVPKSGEVSTTKYECAECGEDVAVGIEGIQLWNEKLEECQYLHGKCSLKMTENQMMVKGYARDVYKDNREHDHISEVEVYAWQDEQFEKKPAAIQDQWGDDVAPDATAEDCKRLGATSRGGARIDAIIEDCRS